MNSKTYSLKYFKLWLVIGYVLISTVVFLSLMPKPPQILDFNAADKLNHLIAYTSMMFWMGQLYVTRRGLIILALLFSAMGVLIEILQGLGGVRFFEYADMLANCSGVFIGWWLTRYVGKGFILAVERKLLLR